MGVSSSFQSSYERAITSVQNTVNNVATATSSIECNQNFKDIDIKKARFCSTSFINNCSSNAKVVQTTASEMGINIYNNLTSEQKAQSPMLLTASLSLQSQIMDTETWIKNDLDSFCSANASSLLNIVNEKLEVDCECSEIAPCTVIFMNSGTSTADCVVQILNKVAVEVSNTQASKQTTGFNWDLLIIIGGVVGGLSAGIYIINSILNKTNRSTEDTIKINRSLKNTWASRLEHAKSLA